jgi:HEAT repeat protein
MNWLTGGKTGEAKRLVTQLADSSKRDRAAQELIRLGPEAVPVLMEALQARDPSLIPFIQQILSRMPSATPTLIKALSTAHPVVRGRVAEIFTVTRDRAAIPALISALRGEFYTVRSRAVLALSNIGDPEFMDEILLLLSDHEAEVRIAAVTALGKYGVPYTFDRMSNLLFYDPILEVRQATARALGNTKHPDAVFFLTQALRDPFWWYEREQAATELLKAIEQMGVYAVPGLIEALGDREGTVRKFAALILGRIGDPRAIEELGMALYDLHHDVSQTAADALAKFGVPAIKVLANALRHPEAVVREHAVIALGRIRDPRVAPLLIDVLHDPVREVQKQAILSLGELNDRTADSALRVIAANRNDSELSTLARQMLERSSSS